ncbi:12415_t:CDS:2, partial [Racocetra persica]
KCPKEDSLRKCLNQYIKEAVSFRDNFSAYNADLSVEYNKRVIHPICGIKLNFPIVARSPSSTFVTASHSYPNLKRSARFGGNLTRLKLFGMP